MTVERWSEAARPWLTAREQPSLLRHGTSTARLRNCAYGFVQSLRKGETTMGHRIQPTAAQRFAPADLLQGLLVVSSFGFWAVMLGLMPMLLVRVWLAG
jgi:hypothetical protein